MNFSKMRPPYSPPATCKLSPFIKTNVLAVSRIITEEDPPRLTSSPLRSGVVLAVIFGIGTICCCGRKLWKWIKHRRASRPQVRTASQNPSSQGLQSHRLHSPRSSGAVSSQKENSSRGRSPTSRNWSSASRERSSASRGCSPASRSQPPVPRALCATNSESLSALDSRAEDLDESDLVPLSSFCQKSSPAPRAQYESNYVSLSSLAGRVEGLDEAKVAQLSRLWQGLPPAPRESGLCASRNVPHSSVGSRAEDLDKSKLVPLSSLRQESSPAPRAQYESNYVSLSSPGTLLEDLGESELARLRRLWHEGI